MTDRGHHPLLRRRDGRHARVTPEELFFDLVYVLAITQISHRLLEHLTPWGAAEALVLWFAVWLGWQYTAWFTNWFDPEAPRVRAVLFASMALGLLMAAAVPQAFGDRGLLFACAYAALQVGRTLFIVWQLEHDHPLSPNYRRMLGWLSISAALWVAGGLVSGSERFPLWAAAVLCEYGAPTIGFALPGLGRSRTGDWTIEGGHLAERCQLFVIVALGETLLVTGATLANEPAWAAPTVIAVLVAFLSSLALWWLYFGTDGSKGGEAISRSPDPGRMGARVHYVHAVLLAGIIVTAVGHEMAIAHPGDGSTAATGAVLVGGPAVFLAGSGLYKRVVRGRWPRPHLGGLVALGLLALLASAADLLVVGGFATLVLLLVGLLDRRPARLSPGA